MPPQQQFIDTTVTSKEAAATKSEFNDSSKALQVLKACEKNNRLWVSNLLQTVAANSLVNTKDCDGWSPLLWSVRHGSTTVSSSLLKAGANVNDQTHTKDSALSVAALYGNTPSGLQLLQSPNCAVNTLNCNGYSPLMYACRYNHLVFAEALIAAGATVNTHNPITGDDSLTLAARNGHQQIILMLINAGAVQFENSPGFQRTLQQAKDDEICHFLVKETRWFLRKALLMALTQGDVIESSHSMSRAQASSVGAAAAAAYKPPSAQELVFFNLHREVALYL